MEKLPLRRNSKKDLLYWFPQSPFRTFDLYLWWNAFVYTPSPMHTHTQNKTITKYSTRSAWTTSAWRAAQRQTLQQVGATTILEAKTSCRLKTVGTNASTHSTCSQATLAQQADWLQTGTHYPTGIWVNLAGTLIGSATALTLGCPSRLPKVPPSGCPLGLAASHLVYADKFSDNRAQFICDS